MAGLFLIERHDSHECNALQGGLPTDSRSAWCRVMFPQSLECAMSSLHALPTVCTNRRRRVSWLLIALSLAAAVFAPCEATAQQKKPNILIIWGDDIGWFNPSCYHGGVMG